MSNLHNISLHCLVIVRLSPPPSPPKFTMIFFTPNDSYFANRSPGSRRSMIKVHVVAPRFSQVTCWFRWRKWKFMVSLEVNQEIVYTVYIYTVIVCKYIILTYTYIVHLRIYTIPSYIWRISWFEWLKASLPIFFNKPTSFNGGCVVFNAGIKRYSSKMWSWTPRLGTHDSYDFVRHNLLIRMVPICGIS